MPRVAQVRDRAERVAGYILAARLPEDGDYVALLTPADVAFLSKLGRHLIEGATAALPQRQDAHFRLSLGQSLLDARDAIETTLIANGQLPERRNETRQSASLPFTEGDIDRGDAVCDGRRRTLNDEATGELH